MRTWVEITDALLARARRMMRAPSVTLRQFVKEGLRRVLTEETHARPFELRDARFRGETGFAPGAAPDSISRTLREVNDPDLPR